MLKLRKFLIVLIITTPIFFQTNIAAESLKTKVPEKKLFLDLTINSFFPSDSEFKAIYKSSILVPEIGIGYIFAKKFYVFGGFEFLKVTGKTPQLSFELDTSQKIFYFGGGYLKNLSSRLYLNGELSIVYLSFTEELKDLELENKGNFTGLRLGTKLQYKISKVFRFFIKLGYTFIKDTSDDITSNYSGFKTGLGVTFFIM